MSSFNKYFYLDESPIYHNKYLIRLHHDEFLFKTATRGSYNVLVARVLNLSYPDYLRYCRDRLGAELIGKNGLYVTAYFDNTPEVKQLVQLLNKRMDYIMDIHKSPYTYKTEEDGTITRIKLNVYDNK